MRFASSILVFLFVASCTFQLGASYKKDRLDEDGYLPKGITREYSEFSAESKAANEQLPSRDEVQPYFRKFGTSLDDELSHVATVVSDKFHYIKLVANVKRLAQLAASLYQPEQRKNSKDWQEMNELMDRLMAPFRVYCGPPQDSKVRKDQRCRYYKQDGAANYHIFAVTPSFRENWNKLKSAVKEGRNPSVELLTEILVHLITHQIYTGNGLPLRFIQHMMKTVYVEHGVPEGTQAVHLAIGHEYAMDPDAEIFYLISAPCASMAECRAREEFSMNFTKPFNMNIRSGDSHAYVNGVHHSRFGRAFTYKHIRYAGHMTLLEMLLMVPKGQFVAIKSFKADAKLNPFLPRTGPLYKTGDSDYVWRKSRQYRVDTKGFVTLDVPEGLGLQALMKRPMTYIPFDVVKFTLPKSRAKDIRRKIANTLIEAIDRQCDYFSEFKLPLLKKLEQQVVPQLKKGEAPFNGDLKSILSVAYYYLFNAVYSLESDEEIRFARRCTTNGQLELEHSLKVGILHKNDDLIKEVTKLEWLDNLPLSIPVPIKYFNRGHKKPGTSEQDCPPEFWCSACERCYDNKHNYYEHQRMIHKDRSSLVCPLDSFAFSSPQSLRWHRANDHLHVAMSIANNVPVSGNLPLPPEFNGVMYKITAPGCDHGLSFAYKSGGVQHLRNQHSEWYNQQLAEQLDPGRYVVQDKNPLIKLELDIHICKVKYCTHIGHGAVEALEHAQDHYYDQNGELKPPSKLDKYERSIYSYHKKQYGQLRLDKTFISYEAEGGENERPLICEEHFAAAGDNKDKQAAALFRNSGEAMRHLNIEHLGRPDGKGYVTPVFYHATISRRFPAPDYSLTKSICIYDIVHGYSDSPDYGTEKSNNVIDHVITHHFLIRYTDRTVTANRDLARQYVLVRDHKSKSWLYKPMKKGPPRGEKREHEESQATKRPRNGRGKREAEDEFSSYSNASFFSDDDVATDFALVVLATGEFDSNSSSAAALPGNITTTTTTAVAVAANSSSRLAVVPPPADLSTSKLSQHSNWLSIVASSACALLVGGFVLWWRHRPNKPLLPI